MRLKRLVARGFKSFADRTEFEFDSRLTGIIGPNGCGKSNVVDAIKWVLGDQRAKSLRGSEMTDVIFKGAEGREAMGMAEVTITFEDPEGRIDGRQEVDISRRLTLDKESSYLLNGSDVRLKDVRDVLLDTGLGTGGYSVMEQGRIDAVLSANPEARRAIFEEAAGVSRFKLQKKEALRKLERTDQNLSRVTDLLEERSRRIRSLRIQAGKARRFHELQAALRDLRAALAVIDGTELRGQLAGHDARLRDLHATMTAADEGRATAADQLAAADAAIAVCADALATVQDALRRCQEELTTHRERAQAQQHRAADRTDELERGRQRSAGLAEQCSERTMALTLARDELVQKEATLIDIHKSLEAQQKATQGSLAALRMLQQEREALRERQLDLLHRRTRLRNVAADAHAKIAAARAREQRLTERDASLTAELQRLADEAQRRQAEDVAHGTRERILQERERTALTDLEGADAAAAAIAEHESTLRHELSQIEGQRGALLAMEAHMEGFDAGPRHVLQQKPAGLRGRLLDLIDIDLEHGKALEAALGPFVQALVVDTREHAAAIVRELAERRIGRVLLLVEEAFGETPPCSMSLLPSPDGAQRLASLVRHVAANGASQKLLGWLLRGVVVADADIADSTRADLCFVTPDGTLVCGPRMEGGAVAEGHTGLVVRKSRIAQLGDEAAGVQQKLESQKAGKDVATGRVDRLKRELREIGDALQAVRRDRQAVEAQQARIAARSADVQREVGELAHERADLSFACSAAMARLGPSLFDQFLLARAEQAASAGEQDLDARIGASEAAARGQQQAEQDLRIRQVQTGEAREGLVRSIRMHEEAVRDFERALQELTDRQHAAEQDRDKALAEQQRLTVLADDLDEQRAELEADKQRRQADVDRVRHERHTVQLQVQEWEQRRSAASDALTQSRLAIADVEHRFQRLEERLREDTGVELRRCLGEVHGVGLEDAERFEGPPAPNGIVEQLLGPPLPPAVVAAFHSLRRLWEQPDFDLAETRKEVQVLQSQRDRLGAVNLDAVKELDAEEGQFSNLEQEVVDLKEARRALMETLKKLEAESKTLFEHTFHEARKNFQEIFRKLFQGGKADMFLSFEAAGGGGAGEDLLEAGIEIVAQPPGKQLQSINLLSGGERSLTAVAILFALFKVRPSPFCILDEVDAALDETNVERFLRVLRDFTDDTQFCIVTHHKRTMAECQVLYGITMQRRGVSSRIAVSLHEVDSFRDGAPAPADPAMKQRIAGEEKVGFA